jgi:hypothetical protein
MAGGGIIALLMMLALAPFEIAKGYFDRIRLLNPRDQALAKTSHGGGMLALGVWAFAFRERMGLSSVGLGALGLGQFAPWVPLLLLAVAAFGLYWLVNGWQMAKKIGEQPGDSFQFGRCMAKIAVSLVIFWFLGAGYRVLDRDEWLWLVTLQWPVRAVAIWCFITGSTKFALLLAVKRRPQQPPPVHASPHGQARYATPAQARRMRQGHGGGKSRIDDMKF